MEKIKAKNFMIAEICFRIIGKLYNQDYIVICTDTGDFAGHLADDTILGRYSNGVYQVFYYFGSKNNKIIKFNFNFDKDKILDGALMEASGADMSFEILSYCSDIEIAKKIYNNNLDLIDL